MRYVILFILIVYVSCTSSNQSKVVVEDTESSDEKEVVAIAGKDSVKSPSSPEIIPQDKIKDTVAAENVKQEQLQKAKINIKVFKNTESSGYGYDIILDGNLYIHQPNIPALPGNRGFANKEDAQMVAELVVHKIRNNIMPPSVEVKELDSLGIK